MRNLALAGRFVGNFVGDVHQKNYNEDKSGRYLGIGNGVSKICHFDNILSISTVIIKKIVPREIFLINIKIASKGFKLVKFGATNARISQAPDKFADRAENALSQGFESIKNNLAYLNMEGSAG